MTTWWVRPAAVVLCLILPIFAVGLVAQDVSVARTAPTAHDAAVSAVYRSEAASLLRGGHTEKANELLQVSLQFDPYHSDAYYYLGMQYIRRQADRERGLLYLVQALENDRFELGSYGSALYQAVRKLIEGGNLSTAEKLFTTFRSTELADADLLWIGARLAFENSRVREGEALAEEGVARYPSDPRFFALLLDRVDLDPHGSPAFREARWIERERSSDARYLAVLLRYISLLRDNSRRRALVEDYIALGGENPGVYLQGLAAGLSPDDMVSGFLEQGGAADSVLFRDMFAAVYERERPELLEALLQPFDGFSGSVYGGWTESGFYTERLELQDGVPVRIESFPFGSARPLTSIELTGRGLPRSLVFHLGGRRVAVWFREYPELARVGLGPSGFDVPRETFFLVPDRLRLPFARLLPQANPELPWPLRLPLADAAVYGQLLSVDLAERSFRRVERHVLSGAAYAVTELYRGRVLRQVFDESGNGRIDHILVFSGGLPVRGVRDLNGDGRFDLVELYEGGETVARAVDETGSGMYLYLQVLGPNGAVYWNQSGEPVRQFWEQEHGRGMSLDRFQDGAQPVGELEIQVWAER